MRNIATPEEDPKVLYELCVNSVSDSDLRYRLNEVSNDVVRAASDYSRYGLDNQLYKIIPNDCKNEEIITGLVTKQELKDVYSIHMVGKSKPARKIYDLLLSRSPKGKCPFCGIGHASTLDHYLPKTKYPILAVVPKNLVPSCKDCNTGKKTTTATTAESQCLHPYFNNQAVVNEQWIFAKIESIFSGSVRFFVCAPSHWDDTLKKRVESHFNDFKLASRFSIEAANEFASQRYLLNEFERKNGVQALVDLLLAQADSHFRVYANSWQTAFYQALHSHYAMLENKKNSPHETCPVCEGEGAFVSYSCPLCNGNGIIPAQLEVNISDYQYLKCPECDKRKMCRLCAGNGLISREKAIELARNRP